MGVQPPLKDGKSFPLSALKHGWDWQNSQEYYSVPSTLCAITLLSALHWWRTLCHHGWKHCCSWLKLLVTSDQSLTYSFVKGLLFCLREVDRFWYLFCSHDIRLLISFLDKSSRCSRERNAATFASEKAMLTRLQLKGWGRGSVLSLASGFGWLS